MRRTAALIVGGGPAGAAAAIGLARAGRYPLLAERDRETRDALCGGFLSWTTLDRLDALGVDAWTLGAHRVERLAIFAGRRTAEAALPALAAGLSRRTLDAALLDRAGEAGVGVERGLAVRAIEGGVARFADGGEMRPAATILATGKHDLRGHSRPRDDDDPSIGLRWRLAPSTALARLCGGRIELHLMRHGYGGLVLQEDGGGNFCITVRRTRLDAAGGDPARLLADLAAEAPALAARLDAAAAVGAAQAVANIPYGWRAGDTAPGLYRVGDQAGVIPSLAGEGIGIALASGSAAAAAVGSGVPAARFQAAMARRLKSSITAARGMRGAAEAVVAAPWLLAVMARLPAAMTLAATMTRLR
ncbi:MAG TPA: FAD-dependent monooxygenase [Sphingomonas sp.]|nr:FAD-dependent monooxygenase [Sphingomonas sp.]